MADNEYRGYILTQQKQAPWRWVFLIVTPWFSNIFIEFLSGTTLTLSLNKFISNPMIITFILSLNVLGNIVVGAPLLYTSDRIWTRWGRRKPFFVIGAIPLIIGLFMAPLMPTLALFLPFVLLFLASQDIMITNEPLQQEVTPPHQRGRGSAMFNIMVQLVIMFNMVIILGRFHEVQFVGKQWISGEHVAYWLGALFLVAVLCLILPFVKELKVRSKLIGEKVSPKGFVKNVFGDKGLWPVYLLVFAMVFLRVQVGGLMALLFVEQWDYTTQQMGTNAFIGICLGIVCSSIAGYFADKVDRIKLYIFGLTSTLVIKIGYYIFVQFIDADHTPTLWQIIFTGQLIAVFGMFIGVITQPLMYDFIPRAKMGTAAAGLSIVRCATRWVTLNGAGIFVVVYSKIFCEKGEYDYFSLYLYMILLNIIGMVIIFYFRHQVKTGKLKPVGREGLEEEGGNESSGEKEAPAKNGGAS